MEKSYTTVDKTSWPDGEWKSEPDKIQWKDEETGFPCLIVRSQIGVLCGYVGVSESHPCYEKNYFDVEVDAHGGLTFSDHCWQSDDESTGICHVPEPGDPDNVWWFGFDCAHAFDMAPHPISHICDYLDFNPVNKQSTYKNVDYVKRECKKLAKQLFEMNLAHDQS